MNSANRPRLLLNVGCIQRPPSLCSALRTWPAARKQRRPILSLLAVAPYYANSSYDSPPQGRRCRVGLALGDFIVDTDFEKLVRETVARHETASLQKWPQGATHVDEMLRETVRLLCKTTGSTSRAEFDHYGSGYASFVDAWLFKDEPAFRKRAQHFTGLTILLCRLAPYFCIFEGEKMWSEGGSGASYLPAYSMIDAFRTDAVLQLASEAERSLIGLGWRRLRKEDISQEVPPSIRIPTNLTDPPYREFDALFHWED